MEIINIYFKKILYFGVFFILTSIFFSDFALSFEFINWERGAIGYEFALMNAEEEEKPLILYFHMDPSTWSEKMNKNYLAAYEVDEFLMDIPKAEINPDDGPQEEKLAAKFQVESYPAFFLSIPSFNSKPQRVHPFSKDHDMTINEFLQTIKKLLASPYNKKAYAHFEKKEYEEALGYFKKALDFDPESAYTHYAAGIAYRYIALEKNDLEFLKNAEESYLKALEIEPEHKECKGELEKLQKDMAKMGIKSKIRK